MLFSAHHRTRYLLSDVARRVTSCLLARLVLWLVVSSFPLPTWATTFYSFRAEVLRGISTEALPQERCVTLAERVLARLEQAEHREPDPWLRDDIRIAWIATLYASQGNRQPFIDASYRVLGLHPDKVWCAILARREALLGPESIPQTNRKPMAVSRDGDAPQKTCAYGAREVSRDGLTCDEPTGTSCSTETKREARRTHTSEFGHDAPPAGVAAPAVLHFPAPRKKAA
jgi:hypothetical protein